VEEIPLTGGRVTEGVVLVGDTVRRPVTANATFVRALLAELESQGFEGAPRYLGSDERGREIFSFQPGDVPEDLDASFSDQTLTSAARLIRSYHDATAGSTLSGGDEVACHNDLSPCNFVFRNGRPVGLIDFDAAAPGSRLQDLGYALFLWLNLATDGQPPREQVRRIGLFCRAYGIEPDDAVLDAVIAAVATNAGRLRAAGRGADADWWDAQVTWLGRSRRELRVANR
jgi:Ser/Thr protein kinase RdoA (MazF antagonist)